MSFCLIRKCYENYSLFCRKCKWISKKLYAIIKKKNMHFINKYIRKRDVYEKKIEVWQRFYAGRTFNRCGNNWCIGCHRHSHLYKSAWEKPWSGGSFGCQVSVCGSDDGGDYWGYQCYVYKNRSENISR